MNKMQKEEGGMDKELEVHNFVFNEEDNGGESLMLTTKLHESEDCRTLLISQELVLQSYFNNASFNFSCAVFTPENLRKLANEIDSLIARNR
jgi:hypothetical protein